MQVLKAEVFITTIAYIGVAVASLSLGLGVYGNIRQGEAAEDLAEYNAEVERQKAADALQIGADEAGEARLRARKLISSQIEAGALSGVDTDFGTPLGLLTETAGIGEDEALTIVNNARRQAWGYRAQSRLDIIAGKQAKTKSRLDAAGSALSGASSIFATGRQSGLWK